MEYPKFDTSTADQAAEPVVRFFSSPQMAALKRVSDLLAPKSATAPGALEAQVPEFLDFWVGKSPVAVQNVYKAGLDALNKQAAATFKKPFADLDDSSAGAVIEPGIKVQWNYVPPTDPLAHFLQEARRDIRSATTNSREFAAASSAGGRRQGGMGQYWYSLD